MFETLFCTLVVCLCIVHCVAWKCRPCCGTINVQAKDDRFLNRPTLRLFRVTLVTFGVEAARILTDRGTPTVGAPRCCRCCCWMFDLRLVGAGTIMGGSLAPSRILPSSKSTSVVIKSAALSLSRPLASVLAFVTWTCNSTFRAKAVFSSSVMELMSWMSRLCSFMVDGGERRRMWVDTMERIGQVRGLCSSPSVIFLGIDKVTGGVFLCVFPV
jgi:hypothetical protein